MLAVPAPPRNSLRSLCELRSDNRGESDERSALRARAGTAALLGFAQGAPAAGGLRLCIRCTGSCDEVAIFAPHAVDLSRAAGTAGAVIAGTASAGRSEIGRASCRERVDGSGVNALLTTTSANNDTRRSGWIRL